MPNDSRRLALLTDRRWTATEAEPADRYLANILHDDRLLIDALTRRGWRCERIDWSRTDVDWSDYSAAVFRTTWDYHYRFPQFQSWLDGIEGTTTLCNPASLVRWNLDKHYLGDLISRGVSVVPTEYIERGSSFDWDSFWRRTGWREAVIKPCISAAARQTFRLTLESARTQMPMLQEAMEAESMLIQPFQTSIAIEGEISVMAFGGHCTHAVRKRVKSGDFRVQDDHGGTVHPHTASDEEVALAHQALAACPIPPVYARIDMVRDDRGSMAVMEVELIEPELWLRDFPPAAEAFAAELDRYLGPVS